MYFGRFSSHSASILARQSKAGQHVPPEGIGDESFAENGLLQQAEIADGHPSVFGGNSCRGRVAPVLLAELGSLVRDEARSWIKGGRPVHWRAASDRVGRIWSARTASLGGRLRGPSTRFGKGKLKSDSGGGAGRGLA